MRLFWLEFMFSFIEGFILCDLVSWLSTERKHILKKSILLGILSAVVMQVILSREGFSGIVLMTAPVVHGLVAALVYKVSVKYSVLMALLSMLVIHVYDSVIVILGGIVSGEEEFLQMLLQAGWERYLTGAFMKVSMLLIYLAVKYKMKKKMTFLKQGNLAGRYLMVIVMGGLAGAVYLSYQMMTAIDENVILSVIFFILCLVLAVGFIMFYIRQKLKENTMQFIEQRNDILEENYNNIKGLYESNSKLFHDFKNHIEVLKALAETGEDQELKQYLSAFNLLENRAGGVKWTADPTVNFLLNSKLSAAEQKGIETTVSVDYPVKTNISANDTTTILANLLDNAIEANERNVEHKSIAVTIKPVNATLVIKIVNDCENKPVSRGKKFLTSKADAVHHGWGLKSVQGTVDKYQGFLDGRFDARDKKFTVVVTIPFEPFEADTERQSKTRDAYKEHSTT